jgi:predicted O-linked N-acetylglucosamine transferase (SPINDLY family)
MTPLALEQALQQALGHHQVGRLAEAEALYRQVLAACPDHADVLHLLGVLAGQTGRTAESIELIGRATAANPGVADYHANLAESYQRSGQWGPAAASLRLALALRPDWAEAHNHLGIALVAGHRPEEALAAFGRAIALRPDFAEAHNNLGGALRGLGRLEEAIAAYRRATALRPDFAEAHDNLGHALRDACRLEEAIAAYARALPPRPDPAWAESSIEQGHFLANRGRVLDAIACFCRAVAAQPDLARGWSNLVYALQFHPAYGAPALLAEHRRWEAHLVAPLGLVVAPHANEPSPGRRLRIGYVSPDFRDHVVGHNLRPLFRRHDHRQFEVIVYADVPHPDGFTRDFQADADRWRNIAGWTDDAVARRIRDDGIDILVDLTLHMERNRLLVFARKPAPVQITFAGYPGTTGLSAIDYRLTDPYLDPTGTGTGTGCYAEESVRLPASFWCYEAKPDDPPVNPLPSRTAGFVTFGCLNHPAKVNPPVLALWARVLRGTGDSRLLLMSPAGPHRDEVLRLLEAEGVAPGRVGFATRQRHRRYLELYHGIDLALDTLPYNGHTTSLDALWMGVPVVTLVGGTVVGRAGLSQLTNLGSTELVAATPDEFVRIAVALAGDRRRLESLRAGLRERMRGSPLMDAARFTRGIEAAYRTLWRRWCAGVSRGTMPR